MTRNSQTAHSQYQEILRFVRRRVDSPADAEDVTQEVFASAAESLLRSADHAPPTLGWLYTVARRRLVDEARRRRVATVSLEIAPDPEAPRDDYGAHVRNAFSSALVSLTASQRAVVLLRLVEGRTFGEIADQLNVREETCRVRFMRGLRHLRHELEKEGLRP